MNQKKGQSFMKQNLLGFASQFLGFSANLLFNIIFPIVLGATLFGQMSIALGFAYLLVGIFDNGFNNACMRLVSKFNSKKCSEKAAYSFKYLLHWKVRISVVISLLFAASSIMLSPVYGVSIYSLLIASALIVFISTVNFMTSFFTALGRNEVAVKGTAINVTLLIFLPLSAYLLGWGLLGIIASVLVTFMTTSAYLLLKSRDYLSANDEKVPSGDLWKSIVGFSVISLSSAFIYWGMLLVLGIFESSDKVAFFKISLSWITAIVSLVPISSSVLLSSFVSMKENDPSSLRKYTDSAFKYGLMLIIPAMFGLYFLGPKMVRLVYGAAYSEAGIALSLMCLALPPLFMNGILLSVLTAANRLGKVTGMYAISVVIGIILSFVLSYSNGLMGAVFALVLTNYLIAFLSYMLLFGANVNVRLGHLLRPLLASLIMGAVLFFFVRYASSVFSGVVIILLGFVIYSVALFAIGGISRQDVGLFGRIFAR